MKSGFYRVLLGLLLVVFPRMAIAENLPGASPSDDFIKKFQIDQFIDEKIDCLKTKDDNGLKGHFVKSLEKFKKPAFERILKEYLDAKIPLSEKKEIQIFLEERRKKFEGMSSGARKAYISLITDLSFLLSNIPDDDETGAKNDLFRNEVQGDESGSLTPAVLGEKQGATQEIKSDPVTSEKFSIGKMTVKTIDKDEHFIQLEMEVYMEKCSHESFSEISSTIKEWVKSHLESISNHQAKVEFVDKVLHKMIRERIENEIKKTKSPEGSVKKIFFPEFLVK